MSAIGSMLIFSVVMLPGSVVFRQFPGKLKATVVTSDNPLQEYLSDCSDFSCTKTIHGCNQSIKAMINGMMASATMADETFSTTWAAAN